ncbi:MAG: UDP-3-O-(3-hydroxymyristoyl)glucosamine N-acyltransferase [Pseudomonadota bacterium]
MTLTLAELAVALGAELRAKSGADGIAIERMATLAAAGPQDLSFFSNRRYVRQLKATRAGAVLIDEDNVALCPVTALVVRNPYLGYAQAARLLNPVRETVPGVDPSAVVSERATLGAGVSVGPLSVIEANVELAPNVVIGAGCIVLAGARIGAQSRLVANVTVGGCAVLGERVVLHPGVVIGADGFGIANDDGQWVKVPQIGGVRLGDDVEVGANSTVDRGALEDTVLETGVKVDNLVQIGHNVHIGEHTAIAGCVGIAGSARIGKRCTVGGAVSIGGHLEIVDDVHLTGATVVAKSINQPGVYSSGMMAQDNLSWRRMSARMRRLDDMARRLKALEHRAGITSADTE